MSDSYVYLYTVRHRGQFKRRMTYLAGKFPLLGRSFVSLLTSLVLKKASVRKSSGNNTEATEKSEMEFRVLNFMNKVYKCHYYRG